MENQIFITSYLHDSEERLVKERLSKLDSRASRSLKKVIRALLLGWATGDLKLTSEQILLISPDRRFKRR